MRCAFLIATLILLVSNGVSYSTRTAAAQERIYGAAIPYASSYPRGEANDEIYAEYTSRNGIGAFAPWRAFGVPYAWSPYWHGYGWGYPWRGPWGLGSSYGYGPRAPFAWEQSPYYAWPYEWSYGLTPDGAGLDPYMQLAIPQLEQVPAPLPGPRRMYW